MTDFGQRIAFAGWPKCGKSFSAKRLSETLGFPAMHADEVCRDMEWSLASDEVATWFGRPAPFIIEGISVPRALRKWLTLNREGSPADTIFYSQAPFATLSNRQIGAGRGCDTVWREIRLVLIERGVELRPMSDLGLGTDSGG